MKTKIEHIIELVIEHIEVNGTLNQYVNEIELSIINKEQLHEEIAKTLKKSDSGTSIKIKDAKVKFKIKPKERYETNEGTADQVYRTRG